MAREQRVELPRVVYQAPIPKTVELPLMYLTVFSPWNHAGHSVPESRENTQNKQRSEGAGIAERRSQDVECRKLVLGFVTELATQVFAAKDS